MPRRGTAAKEERTAPEVNSVVIAITPSAPSSSMAKRPPEATPEATVEADIPPKASATPKPSSALSACRLAAAAPPMRTKSPTEISESQNAHCGDNR